MFKDSILSSGLGERFMYGTRVIVNAADRTTHLSPEFINYLIVKYGPGTYLYDQFPNWNNKYNLPADPTNGHNKYMAWVKVHGIPHFEMLFDASIIMATSSIVNDCFNAYIFRDNSGNISVFGRSTCGDNKTSANCPDKSNDVYKGKYANMIAAGIFNVGRPTERFKLKREKGVGCDNAYWSPMHAYLNFGAEDGDCQEIGDTRGKWLIEHLPLEEIRSPGGNVMDIFEIINSDVTDYTVVWNTIAQIVIAIVGVVLSIFTGGASLILAGIAIAALRIIASKLILGQPLTFNDLIQTVQAVIGVLSANYEALGNKLDFLGYTVKDIESYMKQGVEAYQKIQSKDYIGLTKDVFQMSRINMNSVQEFSQAYLNLDITKISKITGMGIGAVELITSHTKNSEMIYNFLANGEEMLRKSSFGYNPIGDVNVQQLLINAVAFDYSEKGKSTYTNLASCIPGSQYGIKALLKSQQLSVDEIGSLIHLSQGVTTQAGVFDRLCADGLKNAAIQNFSRGISDYFVPSVLPETIAGEFAEQIRKDVPEVKTLTTLEAAKKQRTKTVFFPQFATINDKRQAPTVTVYDKQFVE